MKHHLRLAALLLAALALHPSLSAAGAAADPAAESHRLKLGMQAWTLKAPLTFAETVERTAALGVRHVQAYPRQKIGGGIDGQMTPDMDAATREKVLALCKKHNVTLASFGVYTPPTKDKSNEEIEASCRELFAFAKAMGLRDLAIEPPMGKWAEILPIIAQLARETGIRAGIHNHPNPNKPEDYLKKLADLGIGPEIGLYADTGHWARSGWDAVAGLRAAGAAGRLVGVHFTDLTDHVRKAHDVPWGSGACDAAGQLAELRRQKFDGVVYIEYEYRTPALPAEVAASVDWFNRANAAPLADLDANRVPPKGFTRDLTAVAAGRAVSPKPPSADAGAAVAATAKWPAPAPLFAENLSDADLKPGTWVWENGILTAKGGGDIWTKKEYGDFYLSLEFRCAEKTNSGVFLRCSDLADWINNTIEVQILQGDAPNERELVGAVFDCQAPSRQVEIEPGKWYQYVISARGSRVTVLLDGEQLVSMNLAQWKDPGKNPDGTPNKFRKAYKDMAPKGRIGLQYHGAPIEFRNLFIDPI
jgi:sugar phosphate isomerase/epimerase